MWLGLIISFFVTAYAYNDFANRAGQNNQNNLTTKIIKCKTPMVPEGKCIPITACPVIMSLYKKQNTLVSSILTGDTCGYHFGRLFACCPLTTEHEKSKSEETMKPTIDKINHPNMKLLPSEDECGPYSYGSKITGGNETAIDEYPWIAMLLYSNPKTGIMNGCGGSLISNQYVLTAAHCVHPILLASKRLKLYVSRH